MTRHLEHRHAIVTGGGRGIGAAIAAELARAGASLTLMGRDEERLARTAASISAAHAVDVQTLVCDVASEKSVARAFRAALDAAGDPHILVNNAGEALGATFLDTDLEGWERMLAVNLTGAFLCTKQVLPAMLSAGAGRVVNVASTAGLKGYARIAAYCAAKHGVVGLTRALATEYARSGVTFNAVCPAYTESDMAERAIATVAEHGGISAADARKKLERMIPIGRLIRPEEVAAAVAWLCSAEAAAITGLALPVAGGEIQ